MSIYPDYWPVRAIATVNSSRDEPIDDGWDAIDATITLLPPLEPSALLGLDAFSHVLVVYLFDRLDPDAPLVQSRIPRNNPDWPEVGIFAQRAKDRPNRLGVSTCEILGVVGSTLAIRGLDAINGTPVLDLKPYLAEFGPRSSQHQPSWATELMADYY